MPKKELKTSRRLPSPESLSKLLPLVKPYLGKICLAAVLLLLSSAAGLAFPQIVRHLLDAAFVSGDSSLLNRIALGLLALFGVQAILNAIQVYLLTSTSEKVVANLRTHLFAHVIKLSPGFFTEQRTGELTSRLSSDTSILQTVLSSNLSEFTRQSLFLIGGIVLLTLTHPTLTLTTLAVVPIMVGSAIIFGRALRRASTGVQDRLAEATGTADEAFAQIRIVQGFAAEPEETRKYSSHIAEVISAAIKRARIRGTFFGVLTFCGFGSIVVVLWQGGRLVLAGQLSAGALVSFLLYAMYVGGAVASLASLFGAYQEASGAAKRIFDLLGTPAEITSDPDATELPKPILGEVALNNVTFGYQADQDPVLHDISLTMHSGEVIALVGRSGAGKSTIASLIPRFWDVTHGSITLDGRNIKEIPLAQLRTVIGSVPQEPSLFSGTIADNIAYAAAGVRDNVSREEVIVAAKAAHAHEFIERLPNGYDTPVGERGVKLSGGQRQRIAIARVFLKNPAVVILDEATSSLDAESEQHVEVAMENLLKGRTTLIIAHRLSTVRRADRVIVLDRGRIIEQGSHLQLMDAGGLYSKLYRSQFRDGEFATLAGLEA